MGTFTTKLAALASSLPVTPYGTGFPGDIFYIGSQRLADSIQNRAHLIHITPRDIKIAPRFLRPRCLAIELITLPTRPSWFKRLATGKTLDRDLSSLIGTLQASNVETMGLWTNPNNNAKAFESLIAALGQVVIPEPLDTPQTLPPEVKVFHVGSEPYHLGEVLLGRDRHCS
ncbi:hypothetical protein [Propioniferax innocua]|uniref:Uncharacterized protein n=1 Tax=Propioniferax innocua TaxID=1753 RepID=A0A542ZD99_9ACTN|nr:hypothetical protein [Propioniferax innocua]TQL58298.1 hypothetical protein FB460_2158 [Propioniferax innocua]